MFNLYPLHLVCSGGLLQQRSEGRSRACGSPDRQIFIANGRARSQVGNAQLLGIIPFPILFPPFTGLLGPWWIFGPSNKHYRTVPQPVAFTCFGGGGNCECPKDVFGDNGVLINVFPGYQCAFPSGACTWDDKVRFQVNLND